MKELLDLLGPRHAKVMARHFGITSAGLMAQKNVLYINESMESVAKLEKIAIFEIDHIFRTSRIALLEAREKRVRPLTDTKIITGWNGLMITAFASGYMVLHGKSYLDAATRAAEFLWTNMWAESGCLLRIYNDGEN